MLNEVMKGIHFMHKKYILHRDIKATNILFNREGEIKIADLGQSIQCTVENPTCSDIICTPHYVAPEVIRAESGYSSPIDIWSFGILAIELGCANPPFSD
jgi:serine/threonine protein kinase